MSPAPGMAGLHLAACPHGRVGHCCQCEDCGRFTRERGWCARCGGKDPAIGFNDVCGDCADAMGLTAI